jgi:hypothetical protein
MSEKTPDIFSLRGSTYDFFVDFLLDIIITYDLDSIDEGQGLTHPELESTLSCVRLTKTIESNKVIETRTIRGASFAPATLGVASDHFYELVTYRNLQTNEIIDRKLYFVDVDQTNSLPSFQIH